MGLAVRMGNWTGWMSSVKGFGQWRTSQGVAGGLSFFAYFLFASVWSWTHLGQLKQKCEGWNRWNRVVVNPFFFQLSAITKISVGKTSFYNDNKNRPTMQSLLKRYRGFTEMVSLQDDAMLLLTDGKPMSFLSHTCSSPCINGRFCKRENTHIHTHTHQKHTKSPLLALSDVRWTHSWISMWVGSYNVDWFGKHRARCHNNLGCWILLEGKR